MLKRFIVGVFVVLICAAPGASAWLPRTGASGDLTRSVVNINFARSEMIFALINQVLAETVAPTSTLGAAQFGTGPTFNSLLDADGWPTDPSAAGGTGKRYGTELTIPSNYEYPGNYVLTWTGQAEIVLQQIFASGTFTLDTGASKNCTNVSNGRYSGVDAYCVITYVGGGQRMTWQVLAMGQGGNPYLRDVKFYRQIDEVDLQAGKIFRSDWKKALADFNPSAVRVMNLFGGNAFPLRRFEYRSLPRSSGYGMTSWLASPIYPDSTGSVNVEVGSAPGMPPTPLHGEQALFRIGVNVAKIGTAPVSNVTQSATPTVTVTAPIQASVTGSTNSNTEITGIADTSAVSINMVISGTNIPAGARVVAKTATTLILDVPATGTGTGITFTLARFEVGDKIVFTNVTAGMTQLNYASATVTSITNATNFVIDRDTSAFSAWSGTAAVGIYITLDVGGRGAFPISNISGTSPISSTSASYTTTAYHTFYLDLNLIIGSEVVGAWVPSGGDFITASTTQPRVTPQAPTTFHLAPQMGVPLEVLTAMINELNEVSSAGPIHMWINIPYACVISGISYDIASPTSPDYSDASNCTKQVPNVILNGSSGWQPLTKRALLFQELSNETWNPGTGFDQTFYYGRLGQLRYGIANNQFSIYHTMASLMMVADIEAAFPNNDRIRPVMGAQTGAIGVNTVRIYGNTNTNTDPLNIWYPAQYPIQRHWAYAQAPYLKASTSWDAGNLAAAVAQYFAATTDAQRTTAIDIYVQEVVTEAVDGFGMAYQANAMVGNAAILLGLGKLQIGYEGDWDRDVLINTVYGNTTASSTTITGYSGTVAVGDVVQSVAFPFNTRVVTVNAGVSIIVDQPALSSISQVRLMMANETNAYLQAVKTSASWAVAIRTFFELYRSTPGAAMPSSFTTYSRQWGDAVPDGYGLGTTWGDGFSLAWWYKQNYNRRIPMPYLLRRDIDPASNDNTPMFLNQAA